MNERALRIKELIADSGKTYQELEKSTGIKKSSLQRYASGETTKIPLTAIERLAEEFDVPAAFIMWGTEKNSVTENGNGIPPERADFINHVLQMSDEKFENLKQLLQIAETM